MAWFFPTVIFRSNSSLVTYDQSHSQSPGFPLAGMLPSLGCSVVTSYFDVYLMTPNGQLHVGEIIFKKCFIFLYFKSEARNQCVCKKKKKSLKCKAFIWSFDISPRLPSSLPPSFSRPCSLSFTFACCTPINLPCFDTQTTTGSEPIQCSCRHTTQWSSLVSVDAFISKLLLSIVH